MHIQPILQVGVCRSELVTWHIRKIFLLLVVAQDAADPLLRLIIDGGLIRVNEKIASDSFDDSNRDRSKLVSVTPVSRYAQVFANTLILT